MASWSNKNEAHVVVHGFLGGKMLHNIGFQDAADLTMGEMNHWFDNPETRATKATEVATGLHQFVTLFAGAKPENMDIDKQQAINSIGSWLLTKDLTMNQLADKADELYKFKSENN